VHESILVVDRDTNTQLLLFRLFAEAGYAVTSASDGEEAVARIEAERPGLIVANVDVPGKSGVELCRYVKEGPEPIPVVLLAPGVAPEPIEPADAVVGLPIDAAKTIEAVRRLLKPGDALEAPPESKILVVDDDIAILDLLENILGNEGYAVRTAACGREGLGLLEREQADLVLLDVQMPGMSGFEVLTKIRESHNDVPVVMVTGYGSEDVAADALRLGADDYIAKPLRVRNLCFRIERTLEKARLRASQERLNQQLRRTTLELTERLREAHEANAAFRRVLSRVLGALRERLAQGDAQDLIGLVDRLRAAAEAEAPASSCEDIVEALGETGPTSA